MELTHSELLNQKTKLLKYIEVVKKERNWTFIDDLTAQLDRIELHIAEQG